MASRDGPRLPPPNSDPNTTATSSGQTIVKKNAARTRNSSLRSLSAIASTAAMIDVLVKRRVSSVADGAAGEMQEDLLQRRRRHLELGRHRRAARRGLAIELGERIARLDALLAGRRAEDERRRPAVRLGKAVHRIEREQLAVIHDRHAIAEPLRLLHI